MIPEIPIAMLAVMFIVFLIVVGLGFIMRRGLIIMMGAVILLITVIPIVTIDMDNAVVVASNATGSYVEYTYSESDEIEMPPLIKAVLAVFAIVVALIGVNRYGLSV